MTLHYDEAEPPSAPDAQQKRRLLWLLLALVWTLAPFAAVQANHAGSTIERYAVIFVLDGAKPKYFNLAPMPNFRALQARGVTYRNAFVGQEIADTPPSHATIGTGLFPKHHGVMGFWWKDPLTGQMTRPTDNTSVNNGALERVLLEHHVPSIATSLKTQDPRSRVVAVSGHKCYAADAMGTAAADDILCALVYHNRWVAQAMGSHRPPPGAVNNPKWDVSLPPASSGFAPTVEQWRLGAENDWAVRYALWAFHRVHYPRLLMINLPETDVAMHYAGGHTQVAATLMRHFDRELGTLLTAYRQAGILDRTTFLVTADHGMSVAHARISADVLHQAEVDVGVSQVSLEVDTAAAYGIDPPGKARVLALNVAFLGGRNIDATYYKVRVKGRWSYRPAFAQKRVGRQLRRAYLMLCNTIAAAAGPEVLAIYAPHVTTGDRATPGHQYHWLAGHLGPQWDEQHIPLVLAGPGVRRGATSWYPARLVDIAPTVEYLTGAQPAPGDGAVLQDALTRPSARLLGLQHKRGAWLRPMVGALKHRSGYH